MLSVSVGVAMIGLGIIWPLVPVYAVELGAGGFQIGLIIASFNLARTFFNPLAGRLSDRWGRKSFIALGMLLYAVVYPQVVVKANRKIRESRFRRLGSLLNSRIINGQAFHGRDRLSKRQLHPG